MVKRLVSGDFHTSKGAATIIIPAVYPCNIIASKNL